MSAIPTRRRRAVTAGIVASCLGVVMIVTLGSAGYRTLSESTAGRLAPAGDRPADTRRLPFTSTWLIGIIDDSGVLHSVAVGVLDVDGAGGSLVQLPAAAAVAAGSGAGSAPLGAVLAVGGPSAFAEAAERLTGLSFDVVEVADAQRFTQIVTPLGDLPVSLDEAVLDDASGQTWPAGTSSLPAASAARLVTSDDPNAGYRSAESARAAVWSAVAERVGAGIGSASAVGSDLDVPVPVSSDEFVARLFAGPVSFRQIASVEYSPDEITELLDESFLSEDTSGAAAGDVSSDVTLAALDRVEMTMVFAGTAPARLGSPLDAATFRVVNPLGDDEAAEIGRTRSDLTRLVVEVLSFAKVNVVSVAEVDGADPPGVTSVRVADPTLIDRVDEVFEPHFGVLDVVADTSPIEAVDVEIVLGRSFIDRLDSR